MSDRLPKHLHDALDAARLAVEFLAGADFSAYVSNVMLRSAVERQVEIVGEASRRALEDTPELRERLPDLAQAIAIRNRIIHGYDRLENMVVFNTVQRDLPVLIVALNDVLKGLSGDLPDARDDGGAS